MTLNAWLSWPCFSALPLLNGLSAVHSLLQGYTFTVNMIPVSVNDFLVLLLVSVWVYLPVHIHVVGGKVTSWLVHSTLDQVVQVKGLARKIELCCWVRHLTLAVPLSTQVYKWVSVNVVLEVTLQWTNIPSSGEQKILVIASCHKTGISLIAT